MSNATRHANEPRVKRAEANRVAHSFECPTVAGYGSEQVVSDCHHATPHPDRVRLIVAAQASNVLVPATPDAGNDQAAFPTPFELPLILAIVSFRRYVLSEQSAGKSVQANVIQATPDRIKCREKAIVDFNPWRQQRTQSTNGCWRTRPLSIGDRAGWIAIHESCCRRAAAGLDPRECCRGVWSPEAGPHGR